LPLGPFPDAGNPEHLHQAPLALALSIIVLIPINPHDWQQLSTDLNPELLLPGTPPGWV
jgi:hypothetical protein